MHALRGLHAQLTPIFRRHISQRTKSPSAVRRKATVASMATAPRFGQTITQNASEAHSATVFIMHGLGDSGQGLAHIGPTLSLPYVKFICEFSPLVLQRAPAVFIIQTRHMCMLVATGHARLVNLCCLDLTNATTHRRPHGAGTRNHNKRRRQGHRLVRHPAPR